jgi:hypothetical protein
MEHDERDESIENLEEVLESLTTESGNFEDFLGRKAEECASDIILKLKELPIAAESSESRPSNGKPVDAAGDASSTGTNAAGESDNTDSSPNVPGVASEHETKLTIHNHPIVGSYTTETSAPITYDAELKAIYFDTIKLAVADMTAEEIVERFHKLERSVQMIRMQQQGLRVSLEEVLKARTWKDREAIMELDRKHRARVNKKQADKAAKGETAAGAGRKPSSLGRVKTKGMKTADTLKSIGMDREAVATKLKSLNLHDDGVEAYLSKLFS